MGTLWSSLDSLSRSATVSALHLSELVVLAFGLILVIGLIGEIPTEDRKGKSRTFRFLYRTFEIMVILGVSGELIGDGGIFVFSEHLQAISDHEVATLNKEAADERLEAETLKAANLALEKKMHGFVHKNEGLGGVD